MEIKTPAYICYEELLEKNLKILDEVQKESGAKIILALKGYAMHSTFELVSKYLKGVTCSGLWEAKLGYEEFKKYNKDAEIHTYSPAFKDEDIDEIASISDHIVFNSKNQLLKYYDKVKLVNPDIKISVRINPEVSSSPKDIYNPCGIYSRLGITRENFDDKVLNYVDGLNFHALCEQDADALEAVLKGVEEKFGEFLDKVGFVNFGGGHHITKKEYNKKLLINLIKDFKKRWNVEVYLEPGEAVGWECGVLVASVVDIVQNNAKIAILDTSAEAHMPDTIIMPYKAKVRGAGEAGEKKYTYRLAGNTCLAGDVMGDYSFDDELKIGDKIIFEDQIHYTFVKNTTFNGIKLPSIVYVSKDGKIKHQKDFDYNYYKERLS